MRVLLVVGNDANDQPYSKRAPFYKVYRDLAKNSKTFAIRRPKSRPIRRMPTAISKLALTDNAIAAV